MSGMLIEDPVELLLPGPVYLVFALLLLSAMAWWRWRTAPRAPRVVLSVVTVWAYLASTPGFANILLWSLEERHPPPVVEPGQERGQGVVLVLASGYGRVTLLGREIRLGEAGWERVAAGVSQWRRVRGRLIFTGQPVVPYGGSVAQVMAAAAVEMGVPAEHVEVEARSRNTYENLLFARSLVQEGVERVWIVTSAAHLPRVLAVARRLGITAQGVPCDFRAIPYRGPRAWLPHNNAFEKMRIALHEYVGMAYYRWKGWI